MTERHYGRWIADGLDQLASGAFRAGDIGGLARSIAAAFDLSIIGQADGSFLLVDGKPSAAAK